MKIAQLKIILALVSHNCNITRTAEDIYLAQSAVSRQVQLLETELGQPLFIRRGKRLLGPTRLCEQIIKQIAIIAHAETNIRNLAINASQQDCGVLRIATTHTQARFFLPRVIIDFRRQYPGVELVIEQGVPTRLVGMLRDNQADLAICTEAIGEPHDLSSVRCYNWSHSLVTLPDHPLAGLGSPPSLIQLAEQNIVTYSHQFAGGSQLRETFHKANLAPHIVLAAADSDVIKSYVRLGLGVGIIASMSLDSEADQDLYSTGLKHLFGESITRIAWRTDAVLTNFTEHCKALMLKQGKLLENGKTGHRYNPSG